MPFEGWKRCLCGDKAVAVGQRSVPLRWRTNTPANLLLRERGHGVRRFSGGPADSGFLALAEGSLV